MQMNEATEQAAVNAAEEWLALLDAGDSEESWEHAAVIFKSGISEKDFFRSGISKQKWQTSLKAAHDSLGTAVIRRLNSKRYTTELPWEPLAEYVVIEYQTTFARQLSRTEIVTLMKESDGEWRVSEYKFKTPASK